MQLSGGDRRVSPRPKEPSSLRVTSFESWGVIMNQLKLRYCIFVFEIEKCIDTLSHLLALPELLEVSKQRSK